MSARSATRRRWWRRRGPGAGAAAAAALVVGLAGAAACGAWLVLVVADNRTIAALADGRDVPVAADAAPEVLLARADFLIRYDRIDEAQALVAPVAASQDRAVEQALRFNLANARLRAALALLRDSRVDPAVPLVNLAKDDYRRALRLDPEDWDAKYNLDVAMRLVREFPPVELEGEAQPPPSTKLWTELPGLPKGMP